MPKLTVSAIAAVAAAALAASTSANAASLALYLCGKGKCLTVTNPVAVRDVPLTYKKGLRTTAPARPQGFYTVQLILAGSTGGGNSPSAYFIASNATVRIHGPAGGAVWIRVSKKAGGVLRRAAKHLKPFAAPTTLTSASVNRQPVARPYTYLRLWTLGKSTRSARGADGWLPILITGPATPWSDGANALWISRRNSYLKRDGYVVHVPQNIAHRIRAALPLRP